MTYQKTALHFVQIGVVLWLAIIIASKYLVQWTTTQDYHSGIIVIPWVAFSYVLFGLQNIFKAGALIHNQTIALTIFSLVAALLNIILNLLLIPKIGILGTAIATTFSFFVMMILVFRLSHKYLQINWLWKKMISVVLLAIVCSGFGFL